MTDTYIEREGVLYRESESFSPVVSPSEAYERGLLSSDKRLHVLQNRIHYALGDYLNGGSPHSLEVVTEIMADLGIDADPTSPFETLTTYFAHLDSALPSATDQVTVRPSAFDPESYRNNDLEREIVEVQSRLDVVRDLLAGAYLHGSFGDKQYVPNYSDVDLLVVVDGEALRRPASLATLRNRLTSLKESFYYVDPHQHHGAMVVAEPLLRAYNRAYLPPVALSKATSLLGDEPLTVGIRPDRLELRHGFWRVLQTLRRTVHDGVFPSTFDSRRLDDTGTGPLYCFKHFTSLVMLLPSLYRSAVGDPVYKANSFDIPALDRRQIDGDIVRRCSAVRRRYPELIEFERDRAYRDALRSDPGQARVDYHAQSTPDRLWEMLGDGCFRDALALAENLFDQIPTDGL